MYNYIERCCYDSLHTSYSSDGGSAFLLPLLLSDDLLAPALRGPASDDEAAGEDSTAGADTTAATGFDSTGFGLGFSLDAILALVANPFSTA
mmetsp:Transcript_14426/g.28098  ORF Transcript_14426/g.28098 Transcript_14426/m.28098 type:complete len:92 (+) Transcript_14426:76-351(+)